MQTKSYDYVFATYEEDTPSTRVYKLNVNALSANRWTETPHGSLYRIRNGRLQCIIPAEDKRGSSREQILEFLQSLDPVQDEYALEIEFGQDEVGYFIQEPGHRHDGGAARLKTLSWEGVRQALKDMYSG